MTEYLKDVSAVLILVAIISGVAALIFPAPMSSPNVNRISYIRGKYAALFWGTATLIVLLVLTTGYMMFELRHSLPEFQKSAEGQQIKNDICSKVSGCTSIGAPYLLYRAESKNWVLAFDVEAVGSNVGTREVSSGEWEGDVSKAVNSLPFLVRMVIEDNGVIRVTTKKASKKGRK